MRATAQQLTFGTGLAALLLLPVLVGMFGGVFGGVETGLWLAMIAAWVVWYVRHRGEATTSTGQRAALVAIGVLVIAAVAVSVVPHGTGHATYQRAPAADGH